MKEFFTSRFATIQDFLNAQSFQRSDLNNLTSWSFWNEQSVPPSSPYYFTIGIAITLFVTLLIVWRQRLRRLHKEAAVYDLPLNQLLNLIIFIIIISLSYFFFRTQSISYLSSRLVVLLASIVALIWLIWILIYCWRIIPSKRVQYLENERFFRYLPKKKEKMGRESTTSNRPK